MMWLMCSVSDGQLSDEKAVSYMDCNGTMFDGFAKSSDIRQIQCLPDCHVVRVEVLKDAGDQSLVRLVMDNLRDAKFAIASKDDLFTDDEVSGSAPVRLQKQEANR
ncbi:hypothetical protein KOR42_05910 [Thalassoglobus neptunius]|uniref:Uncharacterized protein n=1 Tax=Thalassoglobus neptunius TaxID=1938619 RepID=A0A5C5X4S6_9PLAN|nr:hypothetical protein [Thalassoglobus neptunius]TWT57233.1 hypothetical protein KOR42_05910 [Thalassoglobus neptunius]